MSSKQKKVEVKIENHKMKRSRFMYQPKRAKHTKPPIVVDPQCQEATPEILRIEIDQIFKEFLDNPDSKEYIFPADLNNLQRKYIHHKAQKMNIVSKSYGKEPNRHLHIKKRDNQLSSQTFVLSPCTLSLDYLSKFVSDPASVLQPVLTKSRVHHMKRGGGKLLNESPKIPREVNPTREISEARKRLPIFDNRDEILETIRNNQVIIITSETGSGKTTQVPQFIIEDMMASRKACKIICTQPRRISTVAAAERVSYERGDKLGASVGYQIRLEQNYGFNTNLIYCTTGVLVRNLMNGYDGLANITHIIIDEVHERDKLSDFLLICLKQAMGSFPDLKIILMSATVNTKKFFEYFGTGKILSIPGRLYAIDIVFLEQVLTLTKYMSLKMKEAEVKMLHEAGRIFPKLVYPFLDDALEDYLNFSGNYDYKVHFDDATAHLRMYFMAEGLPVNYQHSISGQTALMIAAFLGDKEFISQLFHWGADANVCCCVGKTAYDYASDNSEITPLFEMVKSHPATDDDNKEAERLLKLFDKTTPDDIIDYDLIVCLIRFIHTSQQEGSILVFLPGYDDIMLCNDKLEALSLDASTYQTFFLHGSMNIKDQNDVFKKLPRKRKIILSTNIAETSITIEDVVFVVDAGKAKEKWYDPYNKVASLQTRWISQACAKQRMGRAGRTKPGMCFRIYSKQRYNFMEPERTPEMLRVSLEELCLHTKVMAPAGMNIYNFLMMAPSAPSPSCIKVAIENLQFLGALDKEEDLTTLGNYLGQLAIEPQFGKMLIFSIIFRCLEPILTLVATMAHKDPFQLPVQANLKSHAADRRRQLVDGIMSDHLMYLQVFKKWQESCVRGRTSEFCNEYFISHSTMNLILETRSQLLGQLRAAGFIPQTNYIEEYNRNANCWPLVKGIICTGSYPNLAYPLNQWLATRTEKRVNIQASSSCANRVITTWLIYDELIKHRNVLLIRGVSAVTAITVGLMCGNDFMYPTPSSISIDDWIEFEFPDNKALHLRTSIENLIQNVMMNSSYVYGDNDYLVLDTLRDILDAEESYVELKQPSFVGEKPKFLLPQNDVVSYRQRNNVQRRANGTIPRVPGYSTYENQSTEPSSRQNNGRYERSSRKNYSAHENVYHARNAKSSTSNAFGESSHHLASSIQNLNLTLPNPADKLLNGLANDMYNSFNNQDVVRNFPVSNLLCDDSVDKFGNIKDHTIFILIKPRQKKNVDIAQHTFKWIFAPQTEKKILHFRKNRKPVYLVYTVNHSYAFQGIAQFIQILNVADGKPTALIEWIYTKNLPYINIRHLRNPYNSYRPLYEGADGQIIEQTIGEELLRIYDGITNAPPRQSALDYQR